MGGGDQENIGSFREMDEQVDTISANGVHLRQIKRALTHRRKVRKRSIFGQQPCHLGHDELQYVLLAVHFTVLDGIGESEESLFWFSGDARYCRERRFLLELGRWT